MSKVKSSLIKVNLKSGNYELACKLALQNNVENNNSVYLPNAYIEVSGVLTKAQWAGYLSQLQQKGFYKASQDSEAQGYFGYVVPEEKE